MCSREGFKEEVVLAAQEKQSFFVTKKDALQGVCIVIGRIRKDVNIWE